MKSPIYIIQAILEIIKKRSKNGEKQQEIEIKKLAVFNPYVSYIALALLFICFLDALFPKISIGDWFYMMTERVINYIISYGG